MQVHPQSNISQHSDFAIKAYLFSATNQENVDWLTETMNTETYLFVYWTMNWPLSCYYSLKSSGGINFTNCRLLFWSCTLLVFSFMLFMLFFLLFFLCCSSSCLLINSKHRSCSKQGRQLLDNSLPFDSDAVFWLWTFFTCWQLKWQPLQIQQKFHLQLH